MPAAAHATTAGTRGRSTRASRTWARLTLLIARQVLVGLGDPLKMSCELLVAEDLALRLSEHIGEPLVLRAQHKRAVSPALDQLVGAGDPRLAQPDPLRC